jgi:[calcium/calmodulin-dependent protein kinase] kinase
MQSILGGESYFVEPPMEMDPDEPFPEVGEAHDGLRAGVRKVFRHPFAGFRDPAPGSSDSASISTRPEHSANSSQRPSGVFEGPDSGRASPHIPSRASSATTKRSMEGTRGHARDPLEEEFPYLFIGPSTYTGSHEAEAEAEAADGISEEPGSVFEEPDSLDEPEQIVSESPGAAEFDIYETAYRSELERIKQNIEDRKSAPKVYLTRRVENKDEVMKLAKEKALDLQIGQRFTFATKRADSAFGSAVSALRSQMQKRQAEPGEEKVEPEQHHPPKRASVSGYSEAESSSLEATGDVSSSCGDSKAQLRRLLGGKE